ncbi:MAG: valine--tRNA ligase [Thermoflexales bacterium]|nr:valine--tRNA ligase [Thermoflexales bacterium]
MTELSKTYDPKAVERRIYEWWEKSGYFKPENQRYLDPNEPQFVITIPPPNVTGTLHMGHALTSAIEDLMTRYHRMKGARTLWVPGTDHAGIATQAVVEKKLEQAGRRRRDMTRDEFLAEVWAWKEHSQRTINSQQRAMGISVDWDREAFTLDEARSLAVRTAFKHLYDKGLIYRDTRMVNWDPVQLTGLSDLEVETEEEGEPGFLYYVRYPLQTNRWEGPQHPWGSGRWAEGATEWITVATTRPETILGDTAVMVNPEDDRYTHRVACRAILPAIGREIPIISDQAVDMTFGTGAVKVTPAHDFVDYEVGKRHHLPFVEVMDEMARMNANAGPYAGLDRFECRKRLVADLEKEGLLVKTEPYMVKLGRGQRSGAVVEPRISLQWWCDMKAMAQMAADAVRSGRIKIVPERFEKTWFQWLDNIRDWCISRQLWWGHQIPVWYVENAEALRQAQGGALRADLPTQYCALTEADAYRAAIADWGPDVRLRQDEDVLDTWFSSGLWPFSTLGWPNDTEDMRRYYPTTMLETGYDILFFWVARMVMLGLELTGDVPFTTVYLHGLIRTADGKKMSKSRPDKIIDPLELIDTYGADALRFFLVTAGAPGNDIKMDARKVDGKWRSDRIEGARNFANKLWNAARFVLGKLESEAHEPGDGMRDPRSLPDRWITARLNKTIRDVRRLMDDYEYGEAGRLIYDFIWSDFCDWYLEFSKIKPNPAVLVGTLDAALRLLHPFMPFVTEELWQKLKEQAAHRYPLASFDYPALMLAPYPRPDEAATSDDADMAGMALVQSAIHAIRNARAEYNVEQQRRIPALIAAGAHVAYFEEMRQSIQMLARVNDELVIAEQVSAPDQAVTLALGSATVYLPLAGLMDLEAERRRLSDELAELEAQIAKSEGLLASDFSRRAPPAVVERERAKLADLQARRDQVRGRLAQWS